MVRILKNMRGKLVDDGAIAASVAPSYFVEGLMYNVPTDKFGGSYGASFVNSMKWIQENADKTKLICANRQHWLLRANAKTSWNPTDAETFLTAVIQMWNRW